MSGFHHSGTTLMQHMLLRELGYNTTKRYPELRPSSCNPTEVLKYPSKSISEVERLQKISAPVVWMERDGPNTVWSIMKRMKKNDTKTLHKVGEQMCSVKCAARKQNFTFVDLHSLTVSGIPNAVSRFLHSGRRLDGLPSSVDHEKRRKYQATHAVYNDDYDLCFREATVELHQLLRQYETCTCFLK